MAEELELTTTIHAPPEEVYALLRDVEGYEAYSEYVEDVVREGDGGVGTEYGITLSWWKLTYTLRAEVTDLEPPERLGWRLVEDLDARGAWRLDPVEVDDPAIEEATAVTLTARYHPDSADDDALSLPRFVPTDAVVERARPVVEREVERVLSRVVADLEGEPRSPDLTIRIRRAAE